jgi:Holliday junction resolvase
MLVTKADGTQQEFEPSKLLASLRRAGADDTVAAQVAQDIEGDLYRGITTGELYRRAFARLRQERVVYAARYSLKRAILDFGPSGFPFEAYIAELLRAEGYETQIDQIVKGSCAEHEVDVVAVKGGETLYVEAKFHNSAGYKTDLKTTLYVKARMDDINKGKGLIVTNTKFTSAAVHYAQCQNLELLSWEQPQGATLQDRIDTARVYPVTALTTLTRRQKTALLAEKVVLCNGLHEQEPVLRAAGVAKDKLGAVYEEASGLCLRGKGV